MSTDNVSFIWRGRTRSFDPYAAFLITFISMIIFPIIGILGLLFNQASSVLFAIVTYLVAVLITFTACMVKSNPNWR